MSIDFYNLPLDDSKVWEMICQGYTTGIFQVEGYSMKSWAKRLKPKNIEELSDMSALCRPGCLDVIVDGKSTTQRYCDRKNGTEPVTYEIPALEPILKDTYGLIVFQEQALSIAQQIAGFSLEKGETLRKSIGTKDASLMSSLEKEFIEGCLKTGKVTEEQAKTIFGWIRESQRYSFNKCFHKNTKIRLASGEEKSIHQLFVENSREKISSINKDGKFEWAYISDILYSGKQPTLTIELETGDKVTVSYKHKFWGPFGIITADKLKVGSVLYNAATICGDRSYAVGSNFAALVGFCTSHGVINDWYVTVKISNQLVMDKVMLWCDLSHIKYEVYNNVWLKIYFENYEWSYIQDCQKCSPLIKYFDQECTKAFLSGLWLGKKRLKLKTVNNDLRYIHNKFGIPTKLTSNGFEIFGYLGHKRFKEINTTVDPELIEQKMLSYVLPKRLTRQLKADLVYHGITTHDLTKVSANNIFRLDNPGNISYKTIYSLRNFDIPLVNQLLSSDIYPVKIVSITPGPEDHVYDITVDHTHRVIADNVLAMNSHSTAYGIIGYWTAYCKYYYPLKFFLHYLRHAKEKIKPKKEIRNIVDEAKKFNIIIKMPTVQDYFQDKNTDFYIKDGIIYFGLNNVKGVGESQITNIANKLSQLPQLTWLNILKCNIQKTCLNNLICVGFFDKLGLSRRKMLYELSLWQQLSDRELSTLSNIDGTLRDVLVILLSKDRKDGGPHNEKRRDIIQDLIKSIDQPSSDLHDSPEWIHNIEKELLGCSISYHKTNTVVTEADTTCADILAGKNSGTLILDVETVKEYTIKRGKNAGKPMAAFQASDDTGTLNCLIFNEVYVKNRSKLYEEALIVVTGKKSDDAFIVDTLELA